MTYKINNMKLAVFNCLLVNLLYYVEPMNLPEGSPCQTAVRGNDVKSAKCVNLFKCPAVIYDRLYNDHPTICSFDGKVPIVCCPSCTLVNNITDAVRTVSGYLYWKTGDKAWDKCIEYASTLPYQCDTKYRVELGINMTTYSCYDLFHSKPMVFGGRNALLGEFPHMALLAYGDDIQGLDWMCGGTILSKDFVLTAAHCLASNRLGPVTRIAVGILKRSDRESSWQIRLVKKRIPHPDYQWPSQYHDIALIEADRPFEFSTLVLPACLQAPLLDEERLREGAEIVATGWGVVDFRKNLADVLQVVALEERSNEQCSGLYPASRNLKRGFDHSTQMCFGDPGINAVHGDTCEGDSGGPLQYFSETTCTHVVIGVTSAGRPCGFPGGAGIYTRVTAYIPWIENVVWP